MKEGKRRKGSIIMLTRSATRDSDTDKEESIVVMGSLPLTTISDSVKYGTNRTEDAYDRVVGVISGLMFDLLLLKMYLELTTSTKDDPLSKEAFQVMLKMKLLDGKMNEVCYKLLKMIEKQAGIRK
ncbi:hypothetical protein Tco_0673350 [Tanacetum coccineum]